MYVVFRAVGGLGFPTLSLRQSRTQRKRSEQGTWKPHGRARGTSEASGEEGDERNGGNVIRPGEDSWREGEGATQGEEGVREVWVPQLRYQGTALWRGVPFQQWIPGQCPSSHPQQQAQRAVCCQQPLALGTSAFRNNKPLLLLSLCLWMAWPKQR